MTRALRTRPAGRWDMRSTATAVAAVVALIAPSGCGDQGEATIGRSDADTTVDVKLRDYIFDGLPATVKGPKVFFAATNVGTEKHELEVLDPSGTPVDEIESFAPGGSSSLGIELVPGTYTIQCILKTTDGKGHDELGMKSQLQVT